MMRTALDSAAEIRLVVNADDFGMSPGISRGILRAHREGIVTSTSVLGNCGDFDEVRAILADAPELGVGVHLALVGRGPIAEAARVPSLLTAGGRFHERGTEFAAAWTKRAIDAGDLEREFDAQIARVRDAGIKIDHLDTHHHLGFLPVVGRTVRRPSSPAAAALPRQAPKAAEARVAPAREPKRRRVIRNTAGL